MPEHPWIFSQPDRAKLELLRSELKLPRAAAQLLMQRGFDDADKAHAILNDAPGDFADPFLIPDLEAAARRVWTAIEREERIVVHGDYDADGISGTALLTGALRRLGARCEPFVPDRKRDGYGVSRRLVEHAAAKDVSLLITVDTGSSAHEELELTRACGIDAIVCDHHLFEARPAGATYFLNPQRSDSAYPHLELCGCAVAYKLLVGIGKVAGRDIECERELDLVALALLGDQMVITGENRALVRAGLERLQESPRPGMLALLEVAKLTGIRLEAEDLAFQLAPRVNAAGRIASARLALDLLLTEDYATARSLAFKLDELNRRRREIDARITAEATRDAELHHRDGRYPAGLVLASDRWELGVVGISAARVARKFDVPTVVLSIDGSVATGSARSVDDFDLKAALDLCAEHLTRYGGHAAAAGMSLRADSIEAFRAAFERAAGQIPRVTKVPGLRIDAEIGLDELDADMADFLRRFGPFASGHPAPVFATRGLDRLGPPRVVGTKHLKLHAGMGDAARSFIGFSLAERLLSQVELWPSLDLAYRIRYREGSSFDPWELSLVDVRSHEAAPSQQAKARKARQ
ncbi:MAG TPA: single-stranded-DNA-specific exonuclease RecJ [Candidatus Krumholzibacteria bacterium]